jgi:hypothetical protein
MALKRIELETTKEFREMLQGKTASDFSKLIIEEVADALNYTSDPNYVAGFVISINDLPQYIEVTIDRSCYRDTIEKNLKRLEMDERYEDCHFAMQVLKRLDEIESENTVTELLTELNSEDVVKTKSRRKRKKDTWSEWDGELDFTK